jgi:hypothetical protein
MAKKYEEKGGACQLEFASERALITDQATTRMCAAALVLSCSLSERGQGGGLEEQGRERYVCAPTITAAAYPARGAPEPKDEGEKQVRSCTDITMP